MKKEFVGFALLVFIIVMLAAALAGHACAQEEAKQALKNATAGFGEKSNAALEKDFAIPENMQIPARIVFGLKQGEMIDFETLVIMIVLLFIMFMIFLRVAAFIPFFSKGFSMWAAALIMTLLAGVSGGIVEATRILQALFGFGVFGKYAAVSMISIVIIILIIGLGAGKLLGMLKERADVMKAEQTGVNVSVKPMIQQIKKP